MPVQFRHLSVAKTRKPSFAGDNQFLSVAVGCGALGVIGFDAVDDSSGSDCGRSGGRLVGPVRRDFSRAGLCSNGL
jgi:hypothetical protein